jgi:hypothetical protein
MADPALSTPKNLIQVWEQICRLEEPNVNDSLKDYALEALDVARTKILVNGQYAPDVANRAFKEITNMRYSIGSSKQEEVDVGTSTLSHCLKRMKAAGAEEALGKLKLEGMGYEDARESIRSCLETCINNIEPKIANDDKIMATLFPSEEQRNARPNLLATSNLVESSIQITYANSVIEAAREQAKVKGLAQTASASAAKTTSLRLVDADPNAPKTDPVLGTTTQIDQSRVAASGARP